MPPPLNSLTLCVLATILTLAAGPGFVTLAAAPGFGASKDLSAASKEPANHAALIDTLPGSVMIGSASQHPGAGFFESRFSPLTIKDPRGGLQSSARLSH